MTEKTNGPYTLLKIIYALSISPLLAGSILFLYWINKITLHAENIEVRFWGFVIIIFYLLFSALVLMSCIYFFVYNKDEWIKLVLPIIISVITFPIFNTYSGYHSALSKLVYIHIVNNTGEKIDRFWSENFQVYHRDYNDDNDYDNFIFSFQPTYTYEYIKQNDGVYGIKSSKFNNVYVDIQQKNGQTMTYNLGEFYSGDCRTIKTSEMKPRF